MKRALVFGALISSLVGSPVFADTCAPVPLGESIRVIATQGPINAQQYRELTCKRDVNQSSTDFPPEIKPLAVQPIVLKSNKYEIVKPQTHYFQRHVLQQTYTGTLPSSITRIGDAVELILKDTGFRVMSPERTDFDAMYLLFQLPLPKIQRRYERVQLADILITLGGEAFVAYVDDVRREVGYSLAPEFSLTSHHIQTAKKQWLKGGEHRSE